MAFKKKPVFTVWANVVAADGVSGNIRSADFVENIGPRRLKHGGMKFTFTFDPHYFDNAAEEIESFMSANGLERGEHYNIPGWNKASQRSDYVQLLDTRLGGFYITFVDDETFVMTKLSWDISHDTTES